MFIAKPRTYTINRLIKNNQQFQLNCGEKANKTKAAVGNALKIPNHGFNMT
jgi:hypothetical protein